MNIAAIDIGRVNSAIAFWNIGQLTWFEKFSANSIDDLITNLSNMKTYFDTTTHIFIEQQMVSNFRAVQIEAQMFMWFKLVYPYIHVERFPARRKYSTIDKTIFNSQYKRKKWAVDYAKTLIPTHLLCHFNKLQKQGDVADAIVIGTIVLASNH